MKQRFVPEYGRKIEPPLLQKTLLIMMVALLNLDGIWQFRILDKTAFALYLILILILKAWDVIHLGLLFLLLNLVAFYLPGAIRHLPALPLLLPFILSVLLILPFAYIRTTLNWLKIGSIDKTSMLLLAATGLISSAALIGWGFWTDHLGIGVRMVQNVLHLPPWLILLCGIPLFAMTNALAEEVVYRGVLQSALSRIFKGTSLILMLQASAFAAIHYTTGFPNGFTGYLMVFIYGVVLGYLRHRTEGMLAPYLAHVIADLTIGYFLYYMAV